MAGEELQRHFSMDKGLTPERLRAAPAGQHDQPQPLNELFEGDDRLSTGAASQMPPSMQAKARSYALL